MKNKMLVILISILLFSINLSCSVKEMIEKIAKPERDQFAREFIELVRTRQYDKVISLTALPDGQQVNKKELEGFEKYFEENKPVATNLINALIFFSSHGDFLRLEYEIQFAKSWIVTVVTLNTTEDNLKVAGLQVVPISNSLEEINKFTFHNKTLFHYFVFGSLMLIIIIQVVALITCIKTPVKLKWLWILLIIVGSGKLGVNWTTGQFVFAPLSLQLFSGGFVRSGLVGPWIVSFSLPIGAILFFVLKNKRWLRKDVVKTNTESTLGASHELKGSS